MNLKEKVREHFHTNEDLMNGLDAIAESLTGAAGTAEEKQLKLYQRVESLAKAEDLTFDHCWSLFRSRHPEVLKDEDLMPTGFAPKLVRRTEEKKLQAEHEKKIKQDEVKEQQRLVRAMEPEHQKRMARIESIMAAGSPFAEAWEETKTPEELALPQPTLLPQRPRVELPEGAILIHGCDVGWTFPIWPQKS
jgi:hypothetical protein